MGLSSYPSKVTMPNSGKPYPSILGFLYRRFPHLPQLSWEKRIGAGKVLDEDGRPITATTLYTPGKRIYYFREVEQEPVIPFGETILFQNDEILVACKPHFLPVTPGGPYVDECLLNRLRKRTGNHQLAPLHRIDRETAGIVLFSANSKTRGRYSELFLRGNIEKSYEAVAEYTQEPGASAWLVENRIVPGEPWFRMTTAPGKVNARSQIRLVAASGKTGRFQLEPVTGKTHQLRIHMSGLGFKILNDRYYPELQPEQADDFATPLQLIARMVRFHDPITGKEMEFRSTRELSA
jgi:tRNA pseudouridine32 synthase/23S rRNA pseudouridine746 synthase